MKISYLVAVLLLSLMSTIAVAGLSHNRTVEILFAEDGSGQATGAMAAARYSDNEIEYIGCGTRNFVNPDWTLFEFAFCQAGDSAGTEAFCSTTNSELVRAVRAISDSSWLLLRWTPEGECQGIGISGNSFHLFGDKDSKR